eukprot:Opistho-2@73008
MSRNVSTRASMPHSPTAWLCTLQTASLSNLELAVCGGAAGMSSKIAVLPLDIVKKRMQVQGFEGARSTFGRFEHYSGAYNCLSTIVRQEGVLALFKGGMPSVIKAAPASATTFVVYEMVKRAFLKSDGT